MHRPNCRRLAWVSIGGVILIAGAGCGNSPTPATPATMGGGGAPVRGTPINAVPRSSDSAKPAADAGTQSPDAVTQNSPSSATPDATKATQPLPSADASAPAPIAAQKKAANEGPLGKPDAKNAEYLRVVFDELATFDYDPFEAGAPALAPLDGSPAAPRNGDGPGKQPIPDRILALNKKKIAIQGFMVPIEFKKDAVRSFLLVRNQMACCFGVMIGMNEWMLVQMDGDKRAPLVQDVPTSVYGEFDVGEDIQNGMVMSLFRMKGHEVQFHGGR